MKELQEFMSELQAEKSKAHLQWLKFDEKGDRENGSYYDGRYKAFDLMLQKAELLLQQKANSEPQPQLQQTSCSTSVPPSPKAQLTFNSSIQELLAKVHDEIEGRYDLTAEDLFDVQSVLVSCQ